MLDTPDHRTVAPDTDLVHGDPADDDPSAVARICWHTSRIHRLLHRAIDELETAMAEAGEHADAILELATDLSIQPATTDGPGTTWGGR